MARSLRAKVPLLGSLSEAWRELWTRMTDPYRPELHYMRGPGPKWPAKRGG
jgi:hypothetical protein